MDSGNNNPNQPNNLPAVQHTSIQRLGNLIQLSDDVLNESDPLYWYEKAIISFESKENEKAKYYCSKSLLVRDNFSEGYLLRVYIINSILKARNQERDFYFYKDLVSSFTVDFIKSFIQGQFSVQLSYNTDVLFNDEDAPFDIGTEAKRDPIYYYYNEYGKMGIESSVFKIHKKHKPQRPKCEECFSLFMLEKFFAQENDDFSENEKPTIYFAHAISIIYSIQEKDAKYFADRHIFFLKKILEYFEIFADPYYRKWVYLIAAVVSRLCINRNLKNVDLKSPIAFIEQSISLDANFLPSFFLRTLFLTAENKADSSVLFSSLLLKRPDLNLKLSLFYARHNEKFKFYELAESIYNKIISDSSCSQVIKSYSYWCIGNIKKRLNDSGMGYYEAYPFYKKAEECGIEPEMIPYGGLAWKYNEHNEPKIAVGFYVNGTIAEPMRKGDKFLRNVLHILKEENLINETVANGQIQEYISKIKESIKKIPIKEIETSLERVRNSSNKDEAFWVINEISALCHLYKSLAELLVIQEDHTSAIAYYTASLKLLENTGSFFNTSRQELLNLRGNSYLVLSEIDKAKDDFKERDKFTSSK